MVGCAAKSENAARPLSLEVCPSKETGIGERMFGVLSLGFLLGMQHALEADHIPAVSSIAARRTIVRDIAKHGLTWGLGHTLTLFVFAEPNYVLLAGRGICFRRV
jgi:high-affinity nickel permease